MRDRGGRRRVFVFLLLVGVRVAVEIGTDSSGRMVMHGRVGIEIAGEIRPEFVEDFFAR